MIVYTLPSSIVSGDSVDFAITGVTDYPSPTWTGKFAIENTLGAAPLVFDLTPGVAPEHRLTLTAEQSATIPWGKRQFQLIWSMGTDRYTDGMGQMLILPDPTLALTQTFSMQCLIKVEAAILKLSQNVNAQVEVDGQRYTKRNFQELIEYRNSLIATVENELSSIGRGTGRGGPKTIHTYF